ncbi:MAG: YgiQ family radical SAM protein [Nitrospirota bacterium]
MNNNFLSISKSDLKQRGWKELDIILITGDAYVDHPSYGTAVIGRVLEDAGFKVGIIAQPDWKSSDDFLRLGKPKLFFGITAGNLDSILSNYTINRLPRRKDDYSPGGKPGLRPNRATIVYANKVKEIFPDTPIVLGGIEASLRRLAHYDYWSDKVRRSILLDAKADILVYGMGEKQIVEIATRINSGDGIKDIPGTVVARSNLEGLKNYILIPSFEEVSANKDKFNAAFKAFYFECDPFRGRTIVQPHGNRFVVQFPPPLPLNTKELDHIYLLSYVKKWHPVYDKEGGVPGFETIRFSIISHRGCCGQCSFCSLYAHQGRIIQSRSKESIIQEIKIMTNTGDFKGTITDIGGPTANLYHAECEFWKRKGACFDKQCLLPTRCPNLKLGYEQTLSLWKDVMKIPVVKHLFIGSGLRYDLLNDKSGEQYLRTLCEHHLSGQLKVAPEHTVDNVLRLMNKPCFKNYEKFVERFKDINKELNKKQYLVNYFITSHPGSDLKASLEMARYLANKHIHPEQIQDFIPLPMTISGCMYYTGKHPFTGEEIYVPREIKERKMQRAIIQEKMV